MPKLSVNLSDAAAEVLRQYMDQHGITLTETVRRAVSVLKYVEDARINGEKILVENKDDKSLHQLIFFQD